MADWLVQSLLTDLQLSETWKVKYLVVLLLFHGYIHLHHYQEDNNCKNLLHKYRETDHHLSCHKDSHMGLSPLMLAFAT